MKTIISSSGLVQRHPDDIAKKLVQYNKWNYCDKATWKRLVRDKNKKLETSEELKRPSSLMA